MRYLEFNYLVYDQDAKEQLVEAASKLGISPDYSSLEQDIFHDVIYLSEEDVRSVTKIIPCAKIGNYRPYELMIEKLIGNGYTHTYVANILKTKDKPLVQYIQDAIDNWDKEDETLLKKEMKAEIREAKKLRKLQDKLGIPQVTSKREIDLEDDYNLVPINLNPELERELIESLKKQYKDLQPDRVIILDEKPIKKIEAPDSPCAELGQLLINKFFDKYKDKNLEKLSNSDLVEFIKKELDKF